MKFIKAIKFGSILTLFLVFMLACSNNDDENQNEESVLNFSINNVYLRFNAVGGANLEDCFYNLVITDGSYEVTPTGCTANNNIQNIVFLNEIRFTNCELQNFPVEYQYNINTPYSGMDSSNLILDITIQNGQATNYTDLTNEIVKTTLTFNSSNSFNFRIELSDGRVLEKSYSGNIINVSAEDGCSLSI